MQSDDGGSALPFVAGPHSTNVGLLILASLPFTALGFLMVLVPDSGITDRFWGFLAIAFFGYPALKLGPYLLSRQPLLIVDQLGFWDRRISRFPVPWQKVEHITPSHRLGTTGVHVTRKQPMEMSAFTWEGRFLQVMERLFYFSRSNELATTNFGLKVNREQRQAAFDQAAALCNGSN